MPWLERQPLARLHVGSIIVGELFRGAYRSFESSPSALTRELHKLRTLLLPRFAGRLLSFDADAPADAEEIWGRLVGMGGTQGRRPPPDDARIAAIALAHDLTVATSNGRDLALWCPTVDPRAA